MHHVTARGNDRRRIFDDDADRSAYLALLGAVAVRVQWHCLAYCLMGNHVHLLIETPEPSLGYGMQRLHGRYARQLNDRRGRSGHVFQGRFKSELLRTDAHLMATVAYIAANPVDAGLCRSPEQWPWSSHAVALTGAGPSWLATRRMLAYYGAAGGDPWRRYLDAVEQRCATPEPDGSGPSRRRQEARGLTPVGDVSDGAEAFAVRGLTPVGDVSGGAEASLVRGLTPVGDVSGGAEVSRRYRRCMAVATAARPPRERSHLGDADLAAVGALLAEPARARILAALGDGRALSATVLASEAGVAAPTASGHLSRLLDAGLLEVLPQGRHRYYRLAGPEVGELLEALARVAPPAPVRSLREGRRAEALRAARTCYDHLAGRLGVTLMAALIENGHVTGGDGRHDPAQAAADRLSSPGRDLEYRLAPSGTDLLAGIGVALPQPTADGAIPVRYCIDWSEQHHHLSGAVGRALAQRLFDLRWLTRIDGTRAVRLTPAGRDGLQDLGVAL